MTVDSGGEKKLTINKNHPTLRFRDLKKASYEVRALERPAPTPGSTKAGGGSGISGPRVARRPPGRFAGAPARTRAVRGQNQRSPRPDRRPSELTVRLGRGSQATPPGPVPRARDRPGQVYLPATRRPRLSSRLPSPGAAGTGAGVQVAERDRRAGGGQACGYAARAPRGAARARGAGRRARGRGLGRGTPSLSPSWLTLLLGTRMRGRECSANFVAGSAASERLPPPPPGSRERVGVRL